MVIQLVKNLPAMQETCNARDARDIGSITGLARYPRVGNGNPLPFA